MKLESCSICEPCGAIFFNYSRRSSSTGRAGTGGAPDLANKRAAFPSAPLGKCDCQDGGEGDGDEGRRWKEEARGPSRRKKTLVRVFNLLVYTRITPSYHRAVSPSTPSLLRYVAPVIGDVSAFLRNSSDKGGRGVWRRYTRMIELFSMNYLLGRGIRFWNKIELIFFFLVLMYRCIDWQ